MNSLEIAVIIINYNTSQLTFNCIESILKYEKNKSIEFILIDNASTKEDFQNLNLLTSNIVNLKIIKSKINLGFAAGNMFGYQFSNSKFTAFINSDVLFIEPVFDELLKLMNENQSIGVCGPQILNADLQKTISFRSFEGLRYKMFGKKFLAFTSPKKANMKKEYKSPIEVDFVIGSFMLFNSKAFNKVGGFDINTFLYYEESDICYRLKVNDFKTYFNPNVKYIHLEGKSSTVNYNLKLEFLISYLYVTRKNYGFYKYLIIKNYLILSYMFKAPFKKKNRYIFFKLLKINHGLALSMRHKQIIN